MSNLTDRLLAENERLRQQVAYLQNELVNQREDRDKDYVEKDQLRGDREDGVEVLHSTNVHVACDPATCTDLMTPEPLPSAADRRRAEMADLVAAKVGSRELAEERVAAWEHAGKASWQRDSSTRAVGERLLAMAQAKRAREEAATVAGDDVSAEEASGGDQLQGK